jgi:hypothetical protein
MTFLAFLEEVNIPPAYLEASVELNLILVQRFQSSGTRVDALPMMSFEVWKSWEALDPLA